MDDVLWSRDNVEGVQHDGGCRAVGIEFGRALRKRVGDGKLVVDVNTNVQVSDVKSILGHMLVLRHDGGWGGGIAKMGKGIQRWVGRGVAEMGKRIQ
jgi:hypothetical protein